MKLCIATPMYGGMCSGPYTHSMLVLSDALLKAGIPWINRFVYNESLITRARNALTKQFLDIPDCTHLLFIDADIGFNPDDVISLIKQNKDIICGTYPKKVINWEHVHYAATNGVPVDKLNEYTGEFAFNMPNGDGSFEIDPNKPFEVLDSGTGFMLIQRHVFDEIKVPTYKISDVVYKEYFTTAIHDEKLLSEDYNFCKMARDVGFKIYVAPWVKLDHVGSYIFNGSLYQ